MSNHLHDHLDQPNFFICDTHAKAINIPVKRLSFEGNNCYTPPSGKSINMFLTLSETIKKKFGN